MKRGNVATSNKRAEVECCRVYNSYGGRRKSSRVLFFSPLLALCKETEWESQTRGERSALRNMLRDNAGKHAYKIQTRVGDEHIVKAM